MPRATDVRRVPNRRDVLRAGSLGLFGLGLSNLLRSRASAAEAIANTAAAPATFGRAKSCILLFMWGGPAHQDTWDLKPAAPAEIRGEFKPIATKVPGIQICEHFAAAGPADRQAGDRPLDDAHRRRPSHRRRTFCSPASRRRERPSCAPTGRTSAPCCRGWDAGAIRCRRSCRCGRSSRTTCRGSSSNATASRPAGWARRSIRCRSTPIRPSADYRVGDFHLPPEISVGAAR